MKSKIFLSTLIRCRSTAIASIELGRHYIGYDISADYVKLARKRISEFKKNLNVDKKH